MLVRRDMNDNKRGNWFARPRSWGWKVKATIVWLLILGGIVRVSLSSVRPMPAIDAYGSELPPDYVIQEREAAVKAAGVKANTVVRAFEIVALGGLCFIWSRPRLRESGPAPEDGVSS